MPIPDPTAFLLVLARVAGLMATAPIFSHAMAPLRVRAGVTVVLAAVLAPALVPVGTPPTTLWPLAGAVVVESPLGALLGFVTQIVLAGVALAGQVAGVQMGFGFTHLMDPGEHAQLNVVAQWQNLMVLLVFVLLDVHHLVLRALFHSFRLLPPGGAVVTVESARGVVALGGEVFAVGARLAAPVVVVLLMTNAALGVLARAIPQLNVFVVGFPVNIGVGLLVLGASLPFAIRFVVARFGLLDPLLEQFLGAMAHG